MHSFSKIVQQIIVYTILGIIVIITIYPVVWMIAGSFKDEYEFYNNIWGFASKFRFENYINAWQRANIGQKYLNSIYVTVFFLLTVIPINCCAAYAIARLKFKGRKMLYKYLLMGIMIPNGVLVIPIFSVAIDMHIVNSLTGLFFIYAAQSISFGVFLMRSFFISLPKGLEEAATIDGCSRFKSFLHIIIPLAMPGVMTQVIYCGLNTWNEYMLGSVLIRKTELKTLPLGLEMFTNEYTVYYPEMFAALVCVTLPLIIVYLIAQKSFIEGMTAGALKG